MGNAEFTPLRPRRYGATPAAVDYVATDGALVGEVPVAEIAANDTSAPEIVADKTHFCKEPVSADQQNVGCEPVSAEPIRLPGDGWPQEFSDARDDEEERLAQIREEAIRFAAIATSRALRSALENDAVALTKYVDDALRACGRFGRARVRLHPADVSHYRPRSDVEVVADDTCACGEVVVETEAGSVRGVIDDRAALLARAAAHV